LRHLPGERGCSFSGVPCGHQCLCKECVDRLAARGGQLQCPTCRTDVSRFMQVFIPEPATDEQAEEALKFLEQAKLGCEAAKADQAQAEEARRAADALRAEAREVLADAQTTSANAEAARVEQAEFARAACEAARAEAALEAEAELKQLREERAALVAERAAFEEKLRIAVDEAVKPWREATKGLETRTAEEDTCAREAAAISSEVDRKQAAVAAWSAEALQVTAEEKWAKNEEVNFEASAPGSSSSQPALNDCKPVAPSSSSSSAASAQKNDGDSSSSGPSTEGEQLQQQQQQQLSPQRCGSKRPREEDPDDCTAVDPQLEPWEKCQRAWIEQQSLVISLD